MGRRVKPGDNISESRLGIEYLKILPLSRAAGVGEGGARGKAVGG
jgi:hypothetical protein